MPYRKEKLYITTPNALSEIELQECFALLEEGGAVASQLATSGLRRAFKLAIKCSEDSIVGLGSIKQPLSSYVLKITKCSGFPIDKNSRELGYIAVTIAHRRRGISRQLADLLLEASGGIPIFATTSSPAMKATLKAVGFLQQGVEWQGNRGDALSLWIHAE